MFTSQRRAVVAVMILWLAACNDHETTSPKTPNLDILEDNSIAGADGTASAALSDPVHANTHFGPGTVHIMPASRTGVSNCIPFGNNTFYGFTGFIYRNVPAFTMPAGGKFAFDLGRLNNVPVRRDIYFSQANLNPAQPPVSSNTPSQGVKATTWVKVASSTQTPASPFGNYISGDYELIYTAEQTFTFSGGALIVGVASAPPAAFADYGCDQVLVTTHNGDASGQFYARFFSKPHLDTGVLDNITGGGSGVAIGGIVIQNAPSCMQAPTVTVSASPSALWPANHKYRAITLAVSVNDPCGVPSVVAEAWSDEADDGAGDGATTGDVKAGTNMSSNASPVVGFNYATDALELRAERSGTGDGRAYSIKVSATNAAGTGSATATVTVAHNK